MYIIIIIIIKQHAPKYACKHRSDRGKKKKKKNDNNNNNNNNSSVSIQTILVLFVMAQASSAVIRETRPVLIWVVCVHGYKTELRGCVKVEVDVLGFRP